jgi:hypothetical protein
MCQKLSDIFLPAFMIYFIVIAIQNYGSRKCATPIELWNIGNLFIILSGVLIGQVSNISERLPAALSVVFFLFCSGFISFILVWNILGTYWVINNIAMDNHCLSRFGIFVTLMSQSVIYMLYVFGICMAHALYKFHLGNRKEINHFKEKLTELYSDEEQLKTTDIKQFITTHKSLIERVGILDIEKEMILNQMSQQVTEEANFGECSICIMSFEIGNLKSIMSCSHDFHFDCLMDWFKIKPNCPVCRQPFRANLLERYYDSVTANLGA